MYICIVASINDSCKATLCQVESLTDIVKKHSNYIGGSQEINKKGEYSQKANKPLYTRTIT